MMEHLAAALHYFISFVGIISVIVFVHEWGHYIVARMCGVKIEVFSIGFGPEIFGWNGKRGTRWKISALPFGGYVKMFGDATGASTPDKDKLETLSSEEKKVSFHHKALWQKAAIVAAGPLINFLLTICIFTYFIYVNGIVSTKPIVGELIPDTPAVTAGLKPGDHILRVNGVEVKYFNDIPTRIATNLGSPVDLEVMRGGENIHVSITPVIKTEDDGFGNKIQRPLMGFKSQKLNFEDVPLYAAVWEATRRTYQLCETSLHFLKQIVTGDRTSKELKGPVGIAKLSGQITNSGDDTKETALTILWFIAMLSANLGLINLLPVPLLDGGHLAYYLVEGLRGKPMAEKYQEWGFRLGAALLFTMMAFTLFNDIMQW